MPVQFIWILLVSMVVYIVRAARGPSIWDRFLAFSLVSTKIILLVILFASIQETAFLLDFAIVYVLLGFIGIIFISLFLLERVKGGIKK